MMSRVLVRVTFHFLILSVWALGSTFSEVSEAHQQPDTIQLELDVPADQLPVKVVSWESFRPGQTYSAFFPFLVDIDLDDYDEYLWAYVIQSDRGDYISAVVGCAEPGCRETIFQYNGPYWSARIWSVQAMDVVGDRREELLLLRTVGDSVLLEILSFDGYPSVKVRHLLAARHEREDLPLGWHSLHLYALAGLDLNGDGSRDLIYSRSAKPDSAFERGVVAYDLANQQILWFFPTADLVPAANFHFIERSGQSPMLVGISTSTNNAYSSNGMDSRHSYIFALDTSGRELWRRTIGNEYHYPSSVSLDCDDDGVDEVFVTSEYGSPGSDSVIVAICIDAVTGRDAGVPPAWHGTDGLNLALLSNGDSGQVAILGLRIGKSESVLGKLDADLRPLRTLSGPITGIPCVADLVGDSLSEIVIRTRDGNLAVLNSDLELLGRTVVTGLRVYPYTGPQGPGLLLDNSPAGWDLIGFSQQPLVTRLFARYKWWLAVVGGCLLAAVVYLIGSWVRKLHLSAVGLPSLDKINAMVLVLNRNGRIVYLNDNSLIKQLFGTDLIRQQAYDQSPLARFPRLVDAIRRSFDEPLVLLQERIEVDIVDKTISLELAAYPHIGKNSEFMGKILVCEDITGRLGWERKVVLGEAAQRWIHKLKGSLATANIQLGNLIEAQQQRDGLGNSEAVEDSLNSVRSQINETAATVNKIMRFARIGKPDLVPCSVSHIVDRALEPYLNHRYRDITVAKKQQGDVPPISADSEQLTEVIDNLLSNAVRATGDDGEIAVTVRVAKDLQGDHQEKAVEIVVEDKGGGIAREYLDKIFTPGFSKSGTGTGIGLAIVKEIVDNHHGQILVESEEGEGSRFTVRLPVG